MTPYPMITSQFSGNVEGKGVTHDTLASILSLVCGVPAGWSSDLLSVWKHRPCPSILITLPPGTKPRRWQGRGHRRQGRRWSRKHSVLMSKRACRGNPLTPMPPAGGNLSATLPKGSNRSQREPLMIILSKAVSVDLRQCCQRSTVLKIGSGNVAEPDFASHSHE